MQRFSCFDFGSCQVLKNENKTRISSYHLCTRFAPSGWPEPFLKNSPRDSHSAAERKRSNFQQTRKRTRSASHSILFSFRLLERNCSFCRCTLVSAVREQTMHSLFSAAIRIARTRLRVSRFTRCISSLIRAKTLLAVCRTRRRPAFCTDLLSSLLLFFVLYYSETRQTLFPFSLRGRVSARGSIHDELKWKTIATFQRHLSDTSKTAEQKMCCCSVLSHA